MNEILGLLVVEMAKREGCQKGHIARCMVRTAPQTSREYLSTSFLHHNTRTDVRGVDLMKVQDHETWVRDFLQHAAREWVAIYGEEEPYSELHPSNDSRFLWMAKSIYHEFLEKEGFGDFDIRKPLSSVCLSFPKDGLAILYTHYDTEGDILYIGKSMQVKKRHQMHRQNSYWWNKVCTIEFDLFLDEESLGAAEIAAIEKYQPKYNKRHKQ